MASGPDPNRWTPEEPAARGDGLGNPKFSRLGFPSWLSALIAVIILAFIAGVMFF